MLQSQALLARLAATAARWPCIGTIAQAATALTACYSTAAATSSNAPYLARAQLAGQPTHSTHPEVLGPQELAPGLHVNEFRHRRDALARLMPRGSIAIIPAASTTFVSGVVPYPYRQEADFAYLTGILQHSVAVVQACGNAGGPEQHRFILFVPPTNHEYMCRRKKLNRGQVVPFHEQAASGQEQQLHNPQLRSLLSSDWRR